MSLNLEAVRARFSALALVDDQGIEGNCPRIYFDNPSGTQASDSVMERMTACMRDCNANLGGEYRTSILADKVVSDARLAMADLLNAVSPEEIIFGQNMTTLTLHLSRSIGRRLRAGDEILLSQMDHDANVQPWVLLARDLGLTIRWLPFDPDTFEFNLEALDHVLGDRCKLVCVGGASNLTGTINDIREICRRTREVGAITYIDAVQSVPHVSTNVQNIGCDFLVCSAYKFFGPHQGILWGRREVLESLEPYKVRPAPDDLPWSFETGTQSHEGMAGTAAAVDYFAWIGETMAQDFHDRYPDFAGRRKLVHAAMDCLFDYEKLLTATLVNGLQSLDGVSIQGISKQDSFDRRVPTVSFTHDRHDPASIAKALAERNIFVACGHNYALEAARTLGILESGGTVRVGPVHYNSVSEINELIEALSQILR